MPKMKTNSAAKKRFSKKGDKVKYAKAFRRHLLTKKSTSRKRALRRGEYIGASDVKRVLRLLPY